MWLIPTYGGAYCRLDMERNIPAIYIDDDGNEISPLLFAQRRVDPVELVDALSEVARSGGKEDASRVSAATALLDRVWPKPAPDRSVHVNVGLNFRITVPAKNGQLGPDGKASRIPSG